MPAAGSTPLPRPPGAAGLRVSDLLASCAAAELISRPPHVPEPADARTADEHDEAA
ncbi:hypothetical protein [Streptomyces tropicalis]|uniref:Uncharacterized protein n=1 Tax=Streptomyces tropicalis TaxID=3034234 RepID=A0ABT6A8Z9_9ACTN|nr:hypothetical protein [Streptomyces tropicalis]MDF3301123.1 hypothetical protein [Streptomyces tropicalis]